MINTLILDSWVAQQQNVCTVMNANNAVAMHGWNWPCFLGERGGIIFSIYQTVVLDGCQPMYLEESSGPNN